MSQTEAPDVSDPEVWAMNHALCLTCGYSWQAVHMRHLACLTCPECDQEDVTFGAEFAPPGGETTRH